MARPYFSLRSIIEFLMLIFASCCLDCLRLIPVRVVHPELCFPTGSSIYRNRLYYYHTSNNHNELVTLGTNRRLVADNGRSGDTPRTWRNRRRIIRLWGLNWLWWLRQSRPKPRRIINNCRIGCRDAGCFLFVLPICFTRGLDINGDHIGIYFHINRRLQQLT